MNLEPKLLLAAQTELGECPVWDPDRGVLFFMDITGKKLHAYDWSMGEDRVLELPALGGAMALAQDGRLIAGLQNGIHWIDPESGTVEFIIDPEPDKPDHRLNEGKCDPEGRFWVGSISTLGRFPTGCLYRLEKDGSVSEVLTQISVPNTIAWLPDGRHMVFSDSVTKQVWRFRYDAGTGAIGNREVFIDVRNFTGIPDGVAVDAEGGLWIAEFGGGAVHHFSAEGKRVGKIVLPATQVTSCVFAGPDLRHLVIITTKRLLDEDGRKSQPHSGDLFVVEPGVRGLLPHLFQ
ncbi:SMP-30/gluconolactonase/LRE family protein [Rhizobium redzepovicii]|uniref:SMP-30/gluconolactonase/LRE family protein n=1 Tax=Rhizobium redzepovicii TaxID=2867518 RepID=UPI001C92FB09|nr:SMP-30/gluconolactonase/LRE family protein [Rhizobium redzepovicii]MBY4592596.1 SMP-30/gluconolactonase/LRE family protein [Rhizobium redzepovicii]MBY4615410.1 SMP-30/gluconolactonase/LRE family protein [Rhizobium redzepovicii]